jgi:hypothetical protein
MQKLSRSILIASSMVVSAALASYGQISGNLSTTTIPYGSALSLQSINTGFGLAAGGNDSANGSELDAAYGTISGGNLYLFLAGNYENNGNHLNVFVDGGALGQSTLNLNANSGFNTVNGSVFSPGFQATYAYDMNDYQGTLYENEYTYGGAGALNGGYVGAVTESSVGIGAGTPSGAGENSPAFASLAINNNNASNMGTTSGAAFSGPYATTGLELQIPLSQIGYTGGSILVMADINGGGDGYLSNQFLPELPVGTQNVGGGGPYTGPSSAAFNFATTPGEYFTVVPEPSTIGLVIVGLLGALGLRRRKV